MDPIWIATAFAAGFLARLINLPPLVGFLLAGFFLNAMGAEAGELVQTIADLGVTLLLFTIGLKLKLKNLLRPEIWAVASVHMVVSVVAFAAIIKVVALAGVSLFGELSLGSSVLIAFALSFSSTVFAVKVLEEKGEVSALHGRIAIGILIMQDIFAVVFMTFSTGKIPSIWAVALLGLPLLRPLLDKVLDRCGHGELVPLFGLCAALSLGAYVFDLVGLKADLGALVLGMILAPHPRASEMADSLFAFKDVFLVGFFLSIGLGSTPTFATLGVALIFTLLMPLKVGLFFWLLSRFKLRTRTATNASFSLANYSEFGLIVGAVGAANGWIASDWLVVVALALSATFVIASPLNTAFETIYTRIASRLTPFQTVDRHPEEKPIALGGAEAIVVGMGRIGKGTYEYLMPRFDGAVIGIDSNPDRIAQHIEEGRNAILADAADSQFWARVQAAHCRLVMLAMPDHGANLRAALRLRAEGFEGRVAAIATYPDQEAALLDSGVDVVFNTYAEAGAGFAGHVCSRLSKGLFESNAEGSNEEQSSQPENTKPGNPGP